MLADKTECISRSELEILQLERLKKIVAWAYERSVFYRRTFQSRGVVPDDIRTLADVRRLPFVTTEELHSVDALDFLTLPLSSIIRINRRDEFTNLYTKGDIRANVEMMIRALMAADVLRGSIAGILGDFADSRFLDVLYALESIGATVVPLGTDCRRWSDMIELFSLDTLISTPQLIMQLQKSFELPFTKIISLNTSTIGNDLQTRTSAKVFSLFAPPEVGHAGMMYRCADAAG
ncbi:MAG: phenylacetate--CoA ligase family protein, partial [Selenomonadaceae bacterium]|nr:phenylacetate--CoA ligase family protein [Selenomonadaceae bacterium]